VEGKYGGTILSQLEKLGNSCDWDRTRFTMDDGLSDAVAEVFVRLYEKKLIYRGEYIINWCPRCCTALSDEESEHENQAGHLYHIRYPVKGGRKNEYVTVATTRPETLLGDTAVAVNPRDERYAAQGQDADPAGAGPRDSRDRGRFRGSAVRHGRGEGHARARSERFRHGPPPRPADDQRDDRGPAR
jgi:hypothetical protein